jgi:hypothetical protein
VRAETVDWQCVREHRRLQVDVEAAAQLRHGTAVNDPAVVGALQRAREPAVLREASKACRPRGPRPIENEAVPECPGDAVLDCGDVALTAQPVAARIDDQHLKAVAGAEVPLRFDAFSVHLPST